MSDESTNTSNENSGSTRKILLFGVLGLLLLALAYDYRVARPSVELAYDQIVDRSVEVNADSTKMFTNTDVHQLLGKEPSRTFNETNGDLVEVFSWRSGLPIKTHDLFAVYKSSDGKQMFYRHAKYKYDTSKNVSKYNAPVVIQPGDEEETGPGYMDEIGGGGPSGPGGGGGGPGGGGGGPGGGFDPEQIFAENDEDGDGFLKDYEIPERAQENLADIDKDGDGAISKEEWMARMEAMRAQFGGGGRGGRPGSGEERPGQRSRPELESDDEPPTENVEPKAEAPESEAPESEAPEAETPEVEEPKVEEPKAEEPEADKSEKDA